jgi:hypothetical protein
LGVGGNNCEQMAKGEVSLREAALFRAENEGDAAAARDFFLYEWGEIWKRNDRLFGLAVRERAGANDKGAICQRVGEALRDSRVFEQFVGTNSGLCLAPVRLVWSDDGQAREAEVGHGSRRRAYIEGIARGDENHFNAIALVFGEQDVILGQIQGRRRLAAAILHAPAVRIECDRREYQGSRTGCINYRGRSKNHPQGLKPLCLCASYCTAKAVPLQSRISKAVHSKPEILKQF